MHPLTSHALFFKRDHEKTDSVTAWSACAYSCSAKVGPNSVGDPFLRAVDNIIVALSFGSGADVRNVGAS